MPPHRAKLDEPPPRRALLAREFYLDAREFYLDAREFYLDARKFSWDTKYRGLKGPVKNSAQSSV